jgi:hypothetical protein
MYLLLGNGSHSAALLRNYSPILEAKPAKVLYIFPPSCVLSTSWILQKVSLVNEIC